MIYLSEHQTIASQYAIPNAQSNLYWISYMYSNTLLHWWLFLTLYFTLKKLNLKLLPTSRPLQAAKREEFSIWSFLSISYLN